MSLAKPFQDKLLIGEGMKAYWQKQGKAFLGKLCASSRITCDFGTPGGIGFSGSPEAVKLVMDGLKERQLFEKEMSIRKLGFAAHLREDSGKALLQKLQEDSETTVVVKEWLFQVDLTSTFGVQ